MRTLLVTGTDTDVGKTYVSALLLKNLRQTSLQIGVYKPACSGSVIDEDGNEVWTDIQILSQASGVTDTDWICPQRFSAALAPNVAARQQNSSVDGSQLFVGVDRWRNHVDVLLIEGVGGFLCPLTDCLLVSDFAEKLSCEVIVVAANRLGVLNHTLLTTEAIRNRHLQVLGIILNDVNDTTDSSAMSNADQLKNLLPDIPIHHCTFAADQLDVPWLLE